VARWNGIEWSLASTPNIGANRSELWDVAALSSDDIWAVGWHSICTQTCQGQTLVERYYDPCANNECFDYFSTTSSGAAIVPGANLVPGSQCDDCVVNIPLPFTYSLYGYPFNSVNVGANGNLQFASSNFTYTNACLPVPLFNYAMLPHWDDIDMSTAVSPTLGIYTSISGTAPDRIFNIEWRACLYAAGSCGGEVNFEVRLYEGQSTFDFVYGTVAGNGIGATIGVQKATGSRFTQFSCDSNSLQSGLSITFTEPPCATPTPTTTASPTVTATPTNTPAPDAVVVGHVNWQGRPAQPNALQQAPVTLTLKLGSTEVSYSSQTTNASGYFTVSVAGLPDGVYNWRAKGPKFLANSGTIALSGVPTTSIEMGLMRAGDCNNDNLVNLGDFSIVKNAFGTSLGGTNYDDRADLNGDQTVGAFDFNLLRNNFGIGGAPPIGPRP
jgi:hypothetical protein